MPAAPPTHRRRSKSAPRGRSPDPKALRKAAKHAKKDKGKTKDEAFVTPPPKGRTSSPAGSSSSKTDVKRKISFGPTSVHKIRAENPPQKDMDVSEADAILAAMQDTPTFSCDNLLGTPTCSSTVSTSFSNDIYQRSHTTFSTDIFQPYNIPLHFLYFRFPIPLHRTQRKKNHLQKRSSRRRPSRTGAKQKRSSRRRPSRTGAMQRFRKESNGGPGLLCQESFKKQHGIPNNPVKVGLVQSTKHPLKPCSNGGLPNHPL